MNYSSHGTLLSAKNNSTEMLLYSNSPTMFFSRNSCQQLPILVPFVQMWSECCNRILNNQEELSAASPCCLIFFLLFLWSGFLVQYYLTQERTIHDDADCGAHDHFSGVKGYQDIMTEKVTYKLSLQEILILAQVNRFFQSPFSPCSFGRY